MSRRRLLLTLANTFKWLKDKFIYIYNSIIPSKLPSVNIWDEDWELGYIDNTTGQNVSGDVTIRSKNYIRVVPNGVYYIKVSNGTNIYAYDNNKNFISMIGAFVNQTFVVPNNCCYIRFRVGTGYGTTYNHDICINVSNPQINGIYFPYKPKKVQDKARLTMVEGNSEVENQLVPNEDKDYTNTQTDTREALHLVVQLLNGDTFITNLYVEAPATTGAKSVIIAIPNNNSGDKIKIKHSGSQVDLVFTTITGNFAQNTKHLFQINVVSTSPNVVGGLVVKDIQFSNLTQRFPFDTPTSVNDPRVQNIIRQGYKDFNAGKIEDSVVSEIEHRRVPKGFKELTYIESTGTQYIDIGLKGNENSAVEIKAKATASIVFGYRLFGSRNAPQTNGFFISTTTINSDTSIYADYDSQQYNETQPVFNNNIHTYKLSKDGFYYDGQLLKSFTSSTFTTPNNLLIFGGNQSGSITTKEWRVYYCKFYDNGNLVRDFIPCYRESDNVIGLYDAVNGVFYTNAGTDTFIKGEEVEYTNNKITLPQPLKLAGVGTAHNTFEITKDNYVFTRKVFDVELDGSSDEEWVLTSYQRFYIGIDGWKSPSSSIPANLICNKLATSKKEGLDLYENVISGGDPNTWNIFVRINSSIDTIEKLRTWLASNKLNVKYELATPQVINIPRKHLGCVRLKDLEWQYFSGANARFLASSISNIKVVGSNSDVVNAFCSKYRTESWSGVFNHVSDKVIGEASSGIVGVYDSSYTNADDFKASLTDQDILFYETENEVADFIDELECRPNGVLNANQSRVPHEYQEVEYINISGYDFVNTGVIGNLNTKIVVDFYAVAMSTNKTWANVGIGGNYIQPNLSMDGTYRTSRFSDKTITTVNVLSVGNRYKLEIDKTSLRLNGNVLDYFNATASFETPYYLRIGAITNIAGDYVDGSNNFYSCQIYDNDVLVRNFIPCFRKSDGVIGLYDVVEGKFYTNQGTGTFLKGGNIESPICEVLPNVEVELKCK